MSVNEIIDGLTGEAGEAIRALLRRAYDTGFREGLASAGQPPPSSSATHLPTAAPFSQPNIIAASPPQSHLIEACAAFGPATAPPATPQVPATVAWSPDTSLEADAPQNDDGAQEDDDIDGIVIRPILPLATVGTLRRRINRAFALERFDIDVVICRAGDPDRRQLKSSTRLGVYRREEG